jgi:hypothetical protein
VRQILITLTFISILVSCKPYESQDYLNEENNAISDLIPKMLDADYMLAHNDFGVDKPTVYLIDDLYTNLELPEYDSVDKLELKGLTPLTSGEIKSRKISSDLVKRINQFAIKLLPIDEYEDKHNKNLTANFINKELFGYLSISRIVFTDNYKRGYVSFDVFCGEGCGWSSVIEIKKIDGHWTESKFICGGIA